MQASIKHKKQEHSYRTDTVLAVGQLHLPATWGAETYKREARKIKRLMFYTERL
jgi:hypothetical protein